MTDSDDADGETEPESESRLTRRRLLLAGATAGGGVLAGLSVWPEASEGAEPRPDHGDQYADGYSDSSPGDESCMNNNAVFSCNNGVPDSVNSWTEFLVYVGEGGCVGLALGCPVYALASLSNPVPGDEVLVTKACSGGGLTCFAWDTVERTYGDRPRYEVRRAKRSMGRIDRGDAVIVPSN